MDPLPETLQALDMMDPVDDTEVTAQFYDAARLVLAAVPSCVGFSVAKLDEGLVLTMVATDEDTAVLDAMQYLDDGPCVQSVRDSDVVESMLEHPLDEGRWRLFAEAGRGLGVRSSLTMPIQNDDVITGSVNLYASTPHGFDGHHETLARIFHAWPAAAVSNADLSFSTQAAAQEAPRIMTDLARIQAATGMIAAWFGIDVEQARERLRASAIRAGLREITLALQVLKTIDNLDGQIKDN